MNLCKSQVPKLPERKPESLGFDKPSFVYDHSDDQVEKDTILLNYCIDDIEAMCKVSIHSNMIWFRQELKEGHLSGTSLFVQSFSFLLRL